MDRRGVAGRAHVGGCDDRAEIDQRIDHRVGARGVGVLVRAGQRGARRAVDLGGGDHAQGRHARGLGGGDQHRHRRGIAGRADDGALAALPDAGLLGGDERDRVAEELLMIERDPGHHADRRRHRGGGVEAPAEPDLEHRHVGPGPGQHQQPERGDLLEERQLVAARRDHRRVGVDHGGLVGEHAVDGEPLAQRRQVRRAVHADPGPRRPGHRGDQRRRRALAVGAGDVDHRAERTLGVTERRQHRRDAVEPEHDAAAASGVQPRQDLSVRRRHDRSTKPARSRRSCRRRRASARD